MRILPPNVTTGDDSIDVRRNPGTPHLDSHLIRFSHQNVIKTVIFSLHAIVGDVRWIFVGGEKDNRHAMSTVNIKKLTISIEADIKYFIQYPHSWALHLDFTTASASMDLGS